MFLTTVCAALSAAGLAIALLTAYKRRFLRATKIAALSLLPVGLAMAGLVKLGSKVGKAVGDWATDLVFKPTVWAGFGVLAVSVVLFVIVRLASGRGGGRKAVRAAAGSGAGSGAVSSGASTPALTGRAQTPARSGQSGGSEDFGDIEAILKKHGI
jgi:hypothetical protein